MGRPTRTDRPWLAIVVGHNRVAQGAIRVLDRETEWRYNQDLAERIRDLDPDRVRIFFRPPGRGGVRACYREVDAWGADLSVELHFNAVRNRTVSGTETLTSGTDGSRRLAAAIQGRMVSVLGLPDRGCKVRTPWAKRRIDRRGSTSLFAGRAPAVLVEPFFGSNPDDCRRADDRLDALARAIYEGALNS